MTANTYAAAVLYDPLVFLAGATLALAMVGILAFAA